MKISVVIPTLNEPAIGGVITRIFTALGRDTEILVVDSSTDDTPNIAKKAGARVITQKGSGYGDAYLAGFKQVKGDIICMIDGDGTYWPEDLPKLIETVKNNEADICIGNRFSAMEKGAMSFSHRVGNKFLTWLTNKLYGTSASDSQSGMRVIKKDALEKLELHHPEMPLASEMIIEAKKKRLSISELPIRYSVRVGEAKMKSMKHGPQILFYSLRLLRDWNPLILFGSFGIFLIFIGALIGVSIVYQWFATGTITRLASTVLSAMLILSGVFFFGIGLMLDLIVDILRKK